MNIITVIMLFLTYGVLGWIMETTWEIVRRFEFTNRGFLYGQFLPIYGIGALLILLYDNIYHLSTRTDPYEISLLLFGIVLIITILEYLTSYFLELIFNRTWWDYSNIPLNVNGRVSLIFSIVRAGLVYIFLHFIHSTTIETLSTANQNDLRVYAVVFVILFTIDLIMSSYKHIQEIEGYEKIVKPIQKVKGTILAKL